LTRIAGALTRIAGALTRINAGPPFTSLDNVQIRDFGFAAAASALLTIVAS
jgi:hypothetical protein